MADRSGLLHLVSQSHAAALMAGDDPLNADIINETLGQLQILRLGFDDLVTSRTADRTAVQGKQVYTFLMQLAGQAELHQVGQVARLSPGDVALYDHRLAFHYKCTGPAEAILLRVPEALLSQSLPNPEALCGSRVTATEGLAATARAMATTLTDQLRDGLDDFSRRRVANHLLGIMSSCFATEMDRLAERSSIMSNRLWQVKLCVEQHLRNPRLSPAFVATELKISPRYLRMIFAGGQESILAYILRRRLDECAAKLADPQWRGHSITEIAFSYGFNSAPHFTRTFRDRFGTAPRDYRQRVQTDRAVLAVA